MSILPKVFETTFKNFIQLTEDKDIFFANQILYTATSFADEKPYTILAFNHRSEIFETNRDLALTLYLQEIFYLCTRFGEFGEKNCLYYDESNELVSKIIKDINRPFLDFKNFAVEGDKIAFVMTQTHSLKDLIRENKKAQNSTPIDIQKLIEDVYSSIQYINTRFGVSNIEIQPESIYAVLNEGLRNENGDPIMEFYISNWLSGAHVEQSDANAFRPSGMQKIQRFIAMKYDDSRRKYSAPEVLEDLSLKQNTAAEIYALGLTSLCVLGIEPEAWEPLPQMKVQQDIILDEILRILEVKLSKQSMVEKRLSPSKGKEIISVVSTMLKKDPVERKKSVYRATTKQTKSKGVVSAQER